MIKMIIEAVSVVACVAQEPKPWEMGGKSGVTHSAKLAVVDDGAEVASIRLKAKTAEELKAKMASYTIGKPAKVRVYQIVPVFRTGDRKPRVERT